jgi:hypothetical protein
MGSSPSSLAVPVTKSGESHSNHSSLVIEFGGTSQLLVPGVMLSIICNRP